MATNCSPAPTRRSPGLFDVMDIDTSLIADEDEDMQAVANMLETGYITVTSRNSETFFFI